jgi:hypothetical protein
VNGAGDDFFAGAGFALDQGYRVGFGNNANLIQDILKCGTTAHHLFCELSDSAWFMKHGFLSFFPAPLCLG